MPSNILNFAAPLFLLCAISTVSAADDKDEEKSHEEKIERITNLAIGSAERLCRVIGHSTTTDLTIDAKLELSNFAAKLAQIDANAAGKFNNIEYEGVLQKDLEGESRDPIKCKQKVYNDYINRILPPGSAQLNNTQKQKLTSAQTLCDDGEFDRAKSTFNDLLNSAPNNPAVINASNSCDTKSEEYRTVEFSLMYYPGVFMKNQKETPFLAKFNLRIDDSSCGTLSNRNGTGFISCTVKSGNQNFKLSNISLYQPNGAQFSNGGNCGGILKIKPSSDKYGVILCLGESMIRCNAFPFGGSEKFTSDNCVF